MDRRDSTKEGQTLACSRGVFLDRATPLGSFAWDTDGRETPQWRVDLLMRSENRCGARADTVTACLTTYRYEDMLLMLYRLEPLRPRRHPSAVNSQGSGSLGNGRIPSVEESLCRLPPRMIVAMGAPLYSYSWPARAPPTGMSISNKK